MNAKEARKISFENAEKEINEIIVRIEEVARSGNLYFDELISPTAREWLKLNGYKITKIVSLSEDKTVHRIEW